MAGSDIQLERDIKTVKNNLASISNANLALKATLISAIVCAAGILLWTATDWPWIMVLGMGAAMLSSYLCAQSSGGSVIDLDEYMKGGGCGAILWFPVYSLMYMFYVVFGWAVALYRLPKLRNEIAAVLSKYGVSNPEQLEALQK